MKNQIKQISLTQSKVALIDDEDFIELSNYKWCTCCFDGKWYALRYSKDGYKWPENHGKIVLMHKQIMRAEKGQQLDHKDGNGLNNQKSNLRFSTQQQNTFNRKVTGRGTSKFKGVCWNRRAKKWHALIGYNHKRYHLGYFKSEIEAAKAYDAKAKKLFGEFAWLNFKKERPNDIKKQ